MSTSVPLTMVVVAKSAPIQLDHLRVAVIAATDWPAMEGLARTSMNALPTPIAASSSASTLLVDSGVTVTRDSDSTLISVHVLVSFLLEMCYGFIRFSVTVIISNILHFQILTSVPPTMEIVARSVPTWLEDFSVAAAVDIG